MANIERLREAYAIIDGVPEDRMNLNDVASNFEGGDPTDIHHCGTVGCAIGLLAMHPYFQALGLYLERDESAIEYGYSMTKAGTKGYVRVGMEIFDLDYDEAHDLFRPSRDWERAAYGSDKAIWLARVRKFLAEQEA